MNSQVHRMKNAQTEFASQKMLKNIFSKIIQILLLPISEG